MYRTALRVAAPRGAMAQVQSRALSARPLPRHAVLRQPVSPVRTALQRRSYADAPSGGSGNTNTIIILAAIVALGAGGYYMLKPVSDVASTARDTVGAAKQSVQGSGESIATIARGMLPAGALGLYDNLASQPGGLNGFFSSLKDKDLQGVLDDMKKVGGDETKRIVEKVQQKLKDANGSVEKVDWKGLAKELKKELPKDKQNLVDMMIGYIPDKADVDEAIKKIKEIGADQLKQIEASAAKISQQVEKAKKDGKGQVDAFITGLKEAAPEDVDSLIKQLKEAAGKAGLPADQIEAWLKSQAKDKKLDAEAMGKEIEAKLKKAQKFLPSDPKDLVNQVAQISPSVAKLLQQAMEQAGLMKS